MGTQAFQSPHYRIAAATMQQCLPMPRSLVQLHGASHSRQHPLIFPASQLRWSPIEYPSTSASWDLQVETTIFSIKCMEPSQNDPDVSSY